MICGNCAGCFACGKYCSGCPGCHRLFQACGPGERCKLCPYVCPDRPGLPAFLAWRLGNTLELEPVRTQKGVEFPEHLPLVATRLFEEPPADLSSWYALNAAKVSAEFWRSGGVRETYGFPPGSKVALSLYAPDRSLEKFWLRRGERYRTIKEEFDAVFAPNFSVYEDSPRMEHLISMRRSNAVAAEMAKYGIPVVPDISWYNKEDLDRWISCVEKSEISAAAFSFQTVGRSNKSSAAWQSYLAGLRYFHQRVPEEMRIVLVGVNSLTRMAEVFRIVGERKVTFLDTLSFYTARKGGVLKAAGHERAKGVSRDGAFFESVRIFRERLRKAKKAGTDI